VFMDRGKVVGHGTHDALLRTTPGYARLLSAYEDDMERRRSEGAST
jgi:ATP-binding cassette subfamily B protein